MKDELTLRDKLAMSLESSALPEIENKETIDYISKKLGLKWSDDPIEQIEFAFAYQAIMKYRYADIMIKVRDL